jgi:hypothetical protein
MAKLGNWAAEQEGRPVAFVLSTVLISFGP